MVELRIGMVKKEKKKMTMMMVMSPDGGKVVNVEAGQAG